MDRPVSPNMFGAPSPDPERIDPPGGYAHMPAAAPDPAEGATAPMTGDVPPMRTPDTVRRFDPWNYREDAGLGDGSDLIGYRVEATDGHIGKIDEASTIVGDSYLVVDTGPWIFGKKVLLPAGTVNCVDSDEKRVYVDSTKEQIKNSPEYDPETFRDPAYRDKLGGYYSPGPMTPGPIPPGPMATGGMAPGGMAPPLRPDTTGNGPEESPDFPR